MKIFITGANGFIGQHLVEFLSEFDYEIYTMIKKNSLPCFTLKKNIHVVYADLTDKDSLAAVVPKNAIIINLAGVPYHPILSYLVNTRGVENLLEIGKQKRIAKFIQISSQATKLKKMGVYGQTKKMADELIVNSGLSYVILKPSLVYGEGEKGLFVKIATLIEKRAIIPLFGSGNIKINPIHIHDLVKLMKLIIDDNDCTNKIYEPGSVKFITYKQFYEQLAHILKKKVKFIHIPVFIGLIMGKIFTVLKNPPFYIDNVLGSTQSTNPNPYPLLKKYSYEPIDFREGIKTLGAAKKVKVCIVGLGKMGILHASILSTLKNTSITALVDSNKSVHKTMRSLGLKANTYPTLEMALIKEQIDAIFILTPTFTHLDLIKQAQKYHKHIFIEKPVTLNQNEINVLKNFKVRTIIHTGYTLLFKRTYNEVKKILDIKKYGEIIEFRAIFEHSEVNMKKSGWMFSKNKSGGGVLMNPGPHLFSIIYYLFGKPSKVSSKLTKIYSDEVEDQATIKLNYKNFSGDLHLSWSSDNRPLPYLSIEIKLSKAIIVVNGDIILIRKNDNTKTVIQEYSLPPLISPIFNINPEANGESYFIEDKLFIDSILNENYTNSRNSLKNALASESIIQKCYKNNN